LRIIDVNTSIDQHARFLGRDMTNACRVVEHDPGRRVQFTSTSLTFPITVTRTVEPLGDSRSRFTDQARLPAAQGAAGARLAVELAIPVTSL
jgi:hypothetical protein